MNAAFCAMVILGVVYAAATGNLAAAQEALLFGGEEAVQLCLSLSGAYVFFGGMLEVLRRSGATDALSRLLSRPLSRLLRFAPGEERALGDVCVNLSCNMLGMGIAATPAGISAVRTMAAASGGRCSRAAAMFLVLNASCIDLMPTSMIALRAQAGAAEPTDVILPTIAASAVSMAAGAAAFMLIFGRGEM